MPLLGASLLAIAAAAPPTLGRDAAWYERALGRPWLDRTPLPGTGRNVWVTHPRDWGFPSDVNYVHFDNLAAFRLAPVWQAQPVAIGPGWAHLGDLESHALPAGNLPVERASAPGLIDGDRRAAVPGGGANELELEWSTPELLAAVVVWLPGAPPDALSLEHDDGQGYRPVLETSRWPAVPAAGPNRISFAPVAARRLRLRLTALAPVAVAELEAYAPGVQPFALIERKFVAADDVLVARLVARNLGDAAGTFTIAAATDLAAEVLHGIPVVFQLRMQGAPPGPAERRLLLRPGESATLRVAMSLARTLPAGRAALDAWLAEPDPLGRQQRESAAWLLEELPQIDVPDPVFERTLAHRGALLRRTLTDPAFGPFRHPGFVEGRFQLPWYARPISFGAPHQLREARWLRDPAAARGHALNFLENQRADGAFTGFSTLDGWGSEYTEFLAAAFRDLYLVSGDTDLLARALPAMRRNLAHALGRDGDGDLLPLVADHYMTGMEWQPAFFYFSGYDAARPSPLERVDHASNLFAGARAAAGAAGELCDPALAAQLDQLARDLRASLLARMWDEGSRFFYSQSQDDARAWVREIAGFYPWAMDLADSRHDAGLRALFDPTDFALPAGIASSSLRCPATSQDGWPIGPGGSYSMWNGPTWPHALVLAIEGVARAIRRGGEVHVTRAQLFAMIEDYTHAQYEGPRGGKDYRSPAIGEAWRADDGWWTTGERDYFHSTYLDLVIRFLVGLEPAPGEVIQLDPLLPPGTWERFLVEDLRYRGRSLTIVWDSPGLADEYGDGREGFDLWIDGALAASRADLGPLAAELPRDVLLAVKELPGGLPRLTLTPAGSPWSLYRSPDRALARPIVIPGSPFATPDALDPAPGNVGTAYYRAGACGGGR